jgi:diguanylate cyclase (GGDEF)-like protein/PAS domain S-box-containing protein
VEHVDPTAASEPLEPDRVLDVLPDLVVVVDRRGIACDVRGAVGRILGLARNEAIGRLAFDFVHPDDFARTIDALAEAARRDGAHLPILFRIRHASGRWVEIECASRTAGEHVILSVRPLAQRNVLEERRRDIERRSLRIAGHLAAAHGAEIEQALGRAVDDISAFLQVQAAQLVLPGSLPILWGVPQRWPAASDLGSEPFRDHGRVDQRTVFEVAVPAEHLARWWFAWDAADPSAAGWDDANQEYLRLVGDVAASVAARARLETDLARRASLDALTGLVNRSELEHVLGQHLARAGTDVAVLFLDLDRFKAVNDARGHAFGDRVLAHVAMRLATAVRRGDLVGRIGGDEFVVLAGGASEQEALELARRLEHEVASIVSFEGVALDIGVSIGTTIGRPGDDPQRVISAADALMYRAKSSRSS